MSSPARFLGLVPFLVIPLFIACGSSGASGDAADPDASAGPGSPSGPAGPSADAASTPSPDGGSPVDPPPADAGPQFDDAGVQLPSPPAGATLCGQGTITPADAKTACENDGAAPKKCDVVVISGGEWRAYCNPNKPELYVWARFDGLSQTATAGCAGSAPKLSFGGSVVSGAGSALASGSPHQQVELSHPVNVASIDYDIALTSALASGSGAFDIWAVLAQGDGCYPSNDPNASVVLGFNVTWAR